MIASYASALNRCRYCLSAHTWFLQLQGAAFEGAAEALRNGDLDAAGLTPQEHLLLEFAGTIAGAAYKVTNEQVHGLRDVGCTDEQIAEAAYVPALFSLFVRIADPFHIEPPSSPYPNGLHTTGTRPHECT